MKTIEYAADGEAISDHDAEKRARLLFSSPQNYIKVSTDNFILATRALIYENNVSYKDVQFIFEGNIIRIDKGARFLNRPYGFCDCQEGWLTRLLTPR